MKKHLLALNERQLCIKQQQQKTAKRKLEETDKNLKSEKKKIY